MTLNFTSLNLQGENQMSLFNGAWLGLQAGGILSKYLTNREQENNYNNYKTLQTASILNNYQTQIAAIQERYSQEQEAASWRNQQMMIENLKAKATAKVSAAEAGVTGNSIEKLFSGYDRANAVNKYIMESNLAMSGQQYNKQLESVRNQALSAINNEAQFTSTAAAELVGGLGSLLSNYSNSEYRRNQWDYYRRK